MAKFGKGTRSNGPGGGTLPTARSPESFTEDVERTIKGHTIRRKASPKEPAYLRTGA